MATSEAAEAPPTTAEPPTCDVCGALAYEVRCKVICTCCGYTRDCGDP